MAVIKIETEGGVLAVEVDDADLEAAGEALGTSTPAETIKAAVADVVGRSRVHAAYDDISKMVEDGDVDLSSLIGEDLDDGDGEHSEGSVDLAEHIRNVRRALQGRPNVLPEVRSHVLPRHYLNSTLVARGVEELVSDLRQAPVRRHNLTSQLLASAARRVEINCILRELGLSEPEVQEAERLAGRRLRGLTVRYRESEAESSA
ncbi:hypothetical protein AB0E96_14440 [Kitasatospora sp. NPDC036755]|uniref:hypothetical protein n=1 Tax=Kitasatospora sp. NPDC036755 TaxID=3154600 RepID=UPI0033FB40D8